MKTKLIITLKMTTDQYEQTVFDVYVKWCGRNIDNTIQLQKVLNCQPLFNWWYKELEKIETKYLEQVKCYNQSLSPEVALEYYLECTKELSDVFSPPLIRKAIKN